MKKASVSNRIASGIIDYLIVFIFIFFMSYFFGEPTNDGGTSLNGLPALSVVVFWFAWIVLPDYFIGRSFGNWACNIKPVPLESPDNQLSFRQCVARHIFDMVDLSIIGLIIILANDKNQRLGDMVAKTIMIDS